MNGQTDLNISLGDDASQLDEVVVTALGITKSEREIGYAVSEVGGETLDRAREVNVATSLQGQVAGLVVKGTNGGPGGTAKVQLRGVSNLGGTDGPLYVIDGVPMDNTQRGSASQWGGADQGDGIGNISPDDIEKMTVLKGQSASALYGSRATSGGVILITTKKGDKRGDWALTYNSNYISEQAVDFTDFQTEYGQGLGGIKPVTATDAQTTGRFAGDQDLMEVRSSVLMEINTPTALQKTGLSTFIEQEAILPIVLLFLKVGVKVLSDCP